MWSQARWDGWENGRDEVVAFRANRRGSFMARMKAHASFDDYLKDQTPKNQATIRLDERAVAALLRQAARSR